MVCFEPNYVYMRHHYPIDAGRNEKKLKRLNKPSFNKYQPDWIQVPVPCGKCEGCLRDKSNDWATRIVNEFETWNNKGIFVTLTYDNKHLPINNKGEMTLKKKDVKNFKKRLRKYCKKHEPAFKEWINPNTLKVERPIRTFECGEYGEKHGRPHYHMLIMNWTPKDLKYWKTTERGDVLYKSKTLQKIWGLGFTPIGTITYQSAAYTARYTMKKGGISHKQRLYYDITEYDEEFDCEVLKTKYRYIEPIKQPEFLTMSTNPGIGKQYFIDNFEQIRKNSGIIIKDKKGVKIKRIPRYYKKVWNQQNWEDYEKWKYQEQLKWEKRIIKEIEEYNLPNDWSFDKKLKFANDKKIEKFRAKTEKLRKRDEWELDSYPQHCA